MLQNSIKPVTATVSILDRRCYPARVELAFLFTFFSLLTATLRFVVCKTVADVAAAVRDMVTQSLGPYVAVAQGMVLAARLAKPLVFTHFAPLCDFSNLLALRHVKRLLLL